MSTNQINYVDETSNIVVGMAVSMISGTVGYLSVSATAYLFNLAIAASIGTWVGMMCMTAVGAAALYLPVRLFGLWLENYVSIEDSTFYMLGTLIPLAPMVGAIILNFALGWGVALMPMLAMGVLGLAVTLATAMSVACCFPSLENNDDASSVASGERDDAPRHKESKSKLSRQQGAVLNQGAERQARDLHSLRHSGVDVGKGASSSYPSYQ